MTFAQPNLSDDTDTLPRMPSWVTGGRAETLEDVAFLSGAALAMLDVVLRDPGGILPGALLRDRLALKAAVACLKLEGRNEAEADIRDAVCLTRTGDALGPAGEMFARWRAVARINLGTSGWKDRMTKLMPEQVAEGMPELGSHVGTPAGQASQILVGALQQFPRQEAAALMLADVTLARAVGWDQTIPLLAAHLTRKDIRGITDGDTDPVPCVHRAMIMGCDAVLRRAADLSRRASRLRAIAPKLRAKGSDEALALFLSHDAVSPSGMLSPQIKGTTVAMTDRAARRLCDRLVELGVVRELTGRSTFRLYGV